MSSFIKRLSSSLGRGPNSKTIQEYIYLNSFNKWDPKSGETRDKWDVYALKYFEEGKIKITKSYLDGLSSVDPEVNKGFRDALTANSSLNENYLSNKGEVLANVASYTRRERGSSKFSQIFREGLSADLDTRSVYDNIIDAMDSGAVDFGGTKPVEIEEYVRNPSRTNFEKFMDKVDEKYIQQSRTPPFQKYLEDRKVQPDPNPLSPDPLRSPLPGGLTSASALPVQTAPLPAPLSTLTAEEQARLDEAERKKKEEDDRKKAMGLPTGPTPVVPSSTVVPPSGSSSPYSSGSSAGSPPPLVLPPTVGTTVNPTLMPAGLGSPTASGAMAPAVAPAVATAGAMAPAVAPAVATAGASATPTVGIVAGNTTGNIPPLPGPGPANDVQIERPNGPDDLGNVQGTSRFSNTKGAVYHRFAVKMFFGDADKPDWDLQLYANIMPRGPDLEQTEAEKTPSELGYVPKELEFDEDVSGITELMDNIIDEYGPKIFVYKRLSDTKQELMELVQLAFCLNRNLGRGSRSPMAMMPLKSLIKLAGVAEELPVAGAPPGQLLVAGQKFQGSVEGSVEPIPQPVSGPTNVTAGVQAPEPSKKSDVEIVDMWYRRSRNEHGLAKPQVYYEMKNTGQSKDAKFTSVGNSNMRTTFDFKGVSKNQVPRVKNKINFDHFND